MYVAEEVLRAWERDDKIAWLKVVAMGPSGFEALIRAFRQIKSENQRLQNDLKAQQLAYIAVKGHSALNDNLVEDNSVLARENFNLRQKIKKLPKKYRDRVLF